MLINTIRLRGRGQEPWQAYRLSPGAGRFRSYQCLTAPAATLRDLADAVAYALLGEESPRVGEVALQVSDHGGHTWTIHRRVSGGIHRVLRDGTPLGDDGPSLLAAALTDADDGTPPPEGLARRVRRIEVQADGEMLRAQPLGAPESPLRTLKAVVARQISEIASECARRCGVQSLADPRKLTRLARAIAPLRDRYSELCHQYAELKAGSETAGIAEKDLAAVQSLTAELALLDGLAEAAGPLLEPGISLKALKDEAAKIDAELAETSAAVGLEAPAGRLAMLDFRRPIEALARLEAHAKLIRASQGARKACEQSIEPAFKRYLAAAESGLAADRQVQAELESCLASLTLRLRAQDQGSDEAQAAAPHGVKTWFDRFKSRSEEPAREGREAAAEQAAADVETARLAIEFALGRLAELSSGVEAARQRHDGALGVLDEAHEELVRNFGRLRDHWLVVARECHLPEELDLTGLLRIAVRYGRLVALTAAREELTQKLHSYTGRLAKVERLLLDLRRTTGSQKSTPLDNPAFLLAEAKDVLRYHDTKRKRLDQLRDSAAEAQAALALRNLLKRRRKTLMAAWQAAFRELNLAPLEIHHEALGELLQRAELVKALALVHSSTAAEVPAKLFTASTECPAASIYLWDDAKTDNRLRLAFLSQLEEAGGDEPRLLLLADASLAAMLAPLGIGLGARVTVAAESRPPEDVAGARELPAAGVTQQRAEPPRARSTVRPEPAKTTSGAVARGSAKTADQVLLHERARRAIELLSVKKP